MNTAICDDLILLDLQPVIETNTLANRIAKRYKHLKKWARNNATDCFRIYDRDIPEYPFAIDYYAGRFNIQYFSKEQDEDSDLPQDITNLVESSLCLLFGVSAQNIFWKIRKKRARLEQYEKINTKKNYFTVFEHGQRFFINLCDYLDTGLFLDHRLTRQLAASMSEGKSVLNLFAYTGSFTVHCAAHGAHTSTTIDMSNTYIDWAQDNFNLNNLDLNDHKILREDCIKFLKETRNDKKRYDLIILDPPTLSRSKKMEDMFDVQRDHVELLKLCFGLLTHDGEIIFSTNSRRFKLDQTGLSGYKIKDVTAKTLPPDFRDARIHKCWIIKNAL